jgi:hypothetical protein
MAAVRRTFGLYEVTDIIDTGKKQPPSGDP